MTPSDLSDLTARLIDAAKEAGADAADSIVVQGTSVSVDVREGALEHAERSEGIDLGPVSYTHLTLPTTPYV